MFLRILLLIFFSRTAKLPASENFEENEFFSQLDEWNGHNIEDLWKVGFLTDKSLTERVDFIMTQCPEKLWKLRDALASFYPTVTYEQFNSGFNSLDTVVHRFEIIAIDINDYALMAESTYHDYDDNYSHVAHVMPLSEAVKSLEAYAMPQHEK